MTRAWPCLAALALLTGPGAAFAQDGGSADAGSAEAGTASATCVEHLPAGSQRPSIAETFPAKGTSGHAIPLTLLIKHGKGESVLPGGVQMRATSDEARALSRAQFVIPHPDGGAGPSLETKSDGAGNLTTLRLQLVALPEKPGRNELVLPPLPIAIQRASGEVLTLCTKAHPIVIEDPITNALDPKPRDNPSPRRQPEVWTTAKNVAAGALVAAVVALLVALLLGRWLKRPKPVPPPPPPRPPWDVALEALSDLERQDLVTRDRLVEHFEQVSSILRRYCGDRYGFDGLESTTREMLGMLRRVVPPIPALDEIETFLRRADLVKFARLTPDATECTEALSQARAIVERTIPPPLPSTAPTPVRSA
ncbi:MAG: hypothetical protein R3B13_02525 [Polyangiaceae bacterium]